MPGRVCAWVCVCVCTVPKAVGTQVLTHALRPRLLATEASNSDMAAHCAHQEDAVRSLHSPSLSHLRRPHLEGSVAPSVVTQNSTALSSR